MIDLHHIPTSQHDIHERLETVRAAFDDILSRWHHYCLQFRVVSNPSADPTFKQATSPRHWETLDEIAHDAIETSTFKAVDFHVWELGQPYTTAIHVLARNLYTGRSVWMSPRLPKDPIERGNLVSEARSKLTERLASAGIV